MAQQEDGLVIGRYRLVARIADGGMSTVWEAWDEQLHRRVALKQLRLQQGLPEHEAKLAAERAMREARITARLHHAHAVQVYDVVHDGTGPCLVMQYVPSRSLQDLLAERGTLGVTEVARIGSEVAAALAAAHRAGIVHRDVKPGNVLIDEHGSAKITDFGISHAIGDVTLTSTGMVTGTPAYLAPEAARGEPSGYPADVFSLGATLFTAIEASPPVDMSDNPIAVLHQVASGRLRPLSRSTPLGPLLDRMLALDPAARPSMADVQSELAAVAAGAVPESPAHATLRAPVPAPPSKTVMLPPVRGPRDEPEAVPPARPRRSRGTLAAIAIAAGVLLLGGLVVLLVTLGSGSGHDVGSGTQTTAEAPLTSPTSSSSAAPPPSKAAAGGGGESRQSSSSSSSSSPPSEDGLSAAIDDYYALLPDNTDAAWARLTPTYQQDHAGGRQNFDDFWGQFRSVSTSGTRTTGPSTVETTITYTFQDGHTSREITDFGLVDDGGTLKIASSDVVG